MLAANASCDASCHALVELCVCACQLVFVCVCVCVPARSVVVRVTHISCVVMVGLQQQQKLGRNPTTQAITGSGSSVCACLCVILGAHCGV